jgi:PAS domain-containing protein
MFTGYSSKGLYADYENIARHPPDDAQRVQSAVEKQYVDGQFIEYRILRPDGTTRCSRSHYPVADESVISRSLEDITSRKRRNLSKRGV